MSPWRGACGNASRQGRRSWRRRARGVVGPSHDRIVSGAIAARWAEPCVRRRIAEESLVVVGPRRAETRGPALRGGSECVAIDRWVGARRSTCSAARCGSPGSRRDATPVDRCGGWQPGSERVPRDRRRAMRGELERRRVPCCGPDRLGVMADGGRARSEGWTRGCVARSGSHGRAWRRGPQRAGSPSCSSLAGGPTRRGGRAP